MAKIFVRVKNKKQFQTVLEFSPVDCLIADFSCAAIDIANIKKEYPDKTFYLQLPDVMREKKAASVEKIAEAAKGFGGIVLKSFDEIGLVKTLMEEREEFRELKVLGDSFLYAYNTDAIAFYKNFFPEINFILPDELTDREAELLMQSAAKQDLAKPQDFLYKAYGYQPLMITNQCLNRNYAGCEKPLMQFADEQQRMFFMSSECGQCYDIVYNGQPTMMLDKVEKAGSEFEIAGVRYTNLLLDFTIENEADIKRILTDFLSAGMLSEDSPAMHKITRGHHYKGVE